MLRICEISADPRRDRPGFMIVAARYACQSHIRQHIIGWLKRVELMAVVAETGTAVPDNCRELVAQLMALLPGPHWDHWQEHPAETGALLRQMIAGANGAREVA